MKSILFALGIVLMGTAACRAQQPQNEKNNPYYSHTDKAPVKVTDAQWKKVLQPKTYNILREKGTEYANSGPYVHNEKKGTYYCAGCGNALFTSGTKFDSHTGWPSFYEPLKGGVAQEKDGDGFREEVMCARCKGHLGHVFDDGPKPTGLRYCMNGLAMVFEEK